MIKHKAKNILLIFITILFALGSVSTPAFSEDGPEDDPDWKPATSEVGAACCGVSSCPAGWCRRAANIIKSYHAVAEVTMLTHIKQEFIFHQSWLTNTLFKQHILRAMMMMTEQLSAIAFQQVQIGGTFWDAKEQLETQRLTQELEYEAHKDYQPSEDFCYFGTNIRSMHGSNAASEYTQSALNERNIKRHLGNKKTTSAGSISEENVERWKNFTALYCDPADNNMSVFLKNGGLKPACNSGASDKQRINADVDYTRTIDNPRTINANFTKDDPGKEGVDILALINNLYGHTPITRQIHYLDQKGMKEKYMGLRAITAKRNVAQNSMNAIIAMKTSGTDQTTGAPQTAKFMGKLLENLGIPANETQLMLGKNPSYYAQLETLSKRIAQSPEFYSNLYDKPANVTRKGVAIKALDLMIEREMYKSQLRREMLISVLLSSKLKRDADIVNRELR